MQISNREFKRLFISSIVVKECQIRGCRDRSSTSVRKIRNPTAWIPSWSRRQHGRLLEPSSWAQKETCKSVQIVSPAARGLDYAHPSDGIARTTEGWSLPPSQRGSISYSLKSHTRVVAQWWHGQIPARRGKPAEGVLPGALGDMEEDRTGSVQNKGMRSYPIPFCQVVHRPPEIDPLWSIPLQAESSGDFQ